jgi:enterochelin esterase family protein
MAPPAVAQSLASEFDNPLQEPDFRSPELDRAGRLTFRLWAPDAPAAFITVDGLHMFLPEPMHKDAQGVWSYTTPPLAPDIYSYNFVVGGAQIVDPANQGDPLLINGPPQGQSEVLVPGHPPQIWERANVPHGTVAHQLYRSRVIGADEDYYVYTPPGYDPDRPRPYPVLFLLHGLGEGANAWLTEGRADTILDNLIAAGKAVPMVVVMPRSYGIADIAPLDDDPAAQQLHLRHFDQALLRELLPAVAQSYHVSANPADHAIAGLSMGGAEALSIGLAHSTSFSAIGSFSAGLPMLDEDLAKAFPATGQPSLNRNLRLLWISCGTDDPLIDQIRALDRFLADKGTRFTAIETPGGHEWPVWRRDLARFLPLLFRNP